MSWSLKNELCGLAQTESFNQALYNLKIIENINSNFTLHEDNTWKRAGADTYTYKFWIKENEKPEEAFIVKACIAFSLVNNLSEILSEWIYRRKLLSDKGISTPRLFGYGNGIIIEEFVPYTLHDLLKVEVKPTANSIDERLIHLIMYSAALYSLGFLSIAPFDGLRSRGKDAVVIDFGQDLGSAQGKPVFTKGEIFNLMMSNLSKWNVQISNKVKVIMYEIYEEFIRSANSKSTLLKWTS